MMGHIALRHILELYIRGVLADFVWRPILGQICRVEVGADVAGIISS